MRIHDWKVEIRPCGWLRLTEHTGTGPTVFLQYKVTEHGKQRRLDLNAVVMHAAEKEPLSGRVWRRIPLSDIEEALTAFVFGAVPPVQLPADFDVFDSPAEAFEYARAEFFPGYHRGEPEADCATPPVDELEDLFDQYAELTMIRLFDAVFPALASAGTAEEQPPRVTPTGGLLTEEFLRSVADAYRWFSDRGQAPAPGISAVSGSPVRTVHRWILQARKRGILPPARTGRAG
jgi:hypothetical protein